MRFERLIFSSLLFVASLFPPSSFAAYAYYMASMPESLANDVAADPAKLEQALASPKNTLSLGEEWHGVDWLLTRYFEAKGKSVKIVLGGKEVGFKGLYGRPRIYSPADVKELAALLNDVESGAVIELYDPAAMDAASIYPMDWEENATDGRAALVKLVANLKSFIARAAVSNSAVIYTWY